MLAGGDNGNLHRTTLNAAVSVCVGGCVCVFIYINIFTLVYPRRLSPFNPSGPVAFLPFFAACMRESFWLLLVVGVCRCVGVGMTEEGEGVGGEGRRKERVVVRVTRRRTRRKEEEVEGVYIACCWRGAVCIYIYVCVCVGGFSFDGKLGRGPTPHASSSSRQNQLLQIITDKN
jgi:hypothetical protein